MLSAIGAITLAVLGFYYGRFIERTKDDKGTSWPYAVYREGMRDDQRSQRLE